MYKPKYQYTAIWTRITINVTKWLPDEPTNERDRRREEESAWEGIVEIALRVWLGTNAPEPQAQPDYVGDCHWQHEQRTYRAISYKTNELGVGFGRANQAALHG